jgi:hypothetical protein
MVVAESPMSVTGHVIFVDWVEIERQWRDDPDTFAESEFIDMDEGWPARFRAEDWEPENWIESWKAAVEADDAYAQLRDGLDLKSRLALDRILAPFFWTGKPHETDLPGFVPGEGIVNVLNPDTVARLAALAGSIDLESCREPFERRCRPDSGGWIRDFDDFRHYVRQWLDMLDAARRSGKAVVLWVA